MSNQAAVALGSNLGDRLTYLKKAVRELRKIGGMRAVSPLYRTAPVGGPDQDDYLNAVAVIDTPLAPEELLERLHRIEDAAGRRRRERWGPRTLDLDLITMVDAAGNPVRSNSDTLELPHPRAHQRRFVLEPLVSVWPEAPVGDGREAREYVEDVADQPVERMSSSWAGPGWAIPGDATAVGLLVGQFVLYGLFAAALAVDGEPGGAPRLVAGMVVAGAGAALALVAARALGAALSPFPTPVPGSELVTTGPYRWMRHPIYTGVLMMAAGVAVAFSSLAALLVTVGLAGLFYGKARFEERQLVSVHPSYADYARRVRGRLLPLPRS